MLPKAATCSHILMMPQKLKELYDLSKKYHHGADEGSTLGLSWINPDELELFDSELKEIFDWIDENCVIKMVAA